MSREFGFPVVNSSSAETLRAAEMHLTRAQDAAIMLRIAIWPRSEPYQRILSGLPDMAETPLDEDDAYAVPVWAASTQNIPPIKRLHFKQPSAEQLEQMTGDRATSRGLWLPTVANKIVESKANLSARFSRKYPDFFGEDGYIQPANCVWYAEGHTVLNETSFAVRAAFKAGGGGFLGLKRSRHQPTTR